MWPRRHAIRFATYAAAGVAIRRRGWLLALAATAGAGYAAKPIRRATRLLPPGPERIAAGAAPPAVMGLTPNAEMGGYVPGGLGRRRGGGGDPNPPPPSCCAARGGGGLFSPP